MIIDRRTLSNDAVFKGIGLHTGVPVVVTVRPSNQGIRFHYGNDVVEAQPKNVVDTTSCTKLGPIATIEHIMSALAAHEITDADIELTAPELPSLDGSALEYSREFLKVGTETIGQKELSDLFARVFEHSGEAKIAIGGGSGHWRYEFSSTSRFPFNQVFETENVIQDFHEEIAPARTFGWEDDQAAIEQNGLAQGLCMNTVLLLGKDGPVNEPRFADEPCRHKLLDAMGDLYLAGIPISKLNVVCHGSGHRLNIQAAMRLSQFLYEQK